MPAFYALLDGNTNNTDFDLIFVTETWLNDTITNNIVLNGSNKYSILRSDRLISKGGGVCAIYKSEYKCLLVDMPAKFANLEMLCFDMYYNNCKHRYIVVYRPPSASIEITRDIFACLDLLCNINYKFTICGDFNMPHINWCDMSSYVPECEGLLINFIIDNGLFQLVNFPTRELSILDLLIVNDKHYAFNVQCLPPISTSDHCTVSWEERTLVRPSDYQSTATPPVDTSIYNFSGADYGALNQYFSSFYWPAVLPTNLQNDIELLWNAFKQVIFCAIDKFVPKLENISSGKSSAYPTFIKRALNKKKSLWRKRHSKSGKIAYKMQARKCDILLRKHYACIERKLISNGSTKEFFKYVNRKLSDNQQLSPLRDVNGNLITDDKCRAEELNNYFASVFGKSTHSSCDFTPVSDVKPDESPDIDFSPSVVYNAMCLAKHTLSAGPDRIPSLFWAKLASSLCFPVSIIFTTSYAISAIPAEWKFAAVRPLLKKGDPCLVTNYRPISLTCTISKLMESIVRDSLLAHAHAYNILDPNQHGFTPGRSTTTQLLECLYDWHVAADSNFKTDVVYIDFRKAFDSVPHNLVRTKLMQYNYCSRTINWVMQFLSDRTQYVRVNSSTSATAAVTSGIIQGSVLGPALFVLYDIPSMYHDVTIKMYADDIKVYKAIKTVGDRAILQRALNDISDWSFKWQRQIAVDKCQYLQLGYTDNSIDYTINSTRLVPVSTVKDLGVKINTDLKPSVHIIGIAKAANARAKLIAKCFHSRDYRLLIKAFKTYVRPLVEYCVPAWSPHNIGDIIRIEHVQRSFTRNVVSLCRLPPMSYDDRLQFFDLKKLELRRLHCDLTELFKLVKGLSSNILRNVLPFSKVTFTRGHSFKLNVPLLHKTLSKSYFIFRTIAPWNALDQACFNTNIVKCFKNKISQLNMDMFLFGRQ